MKESGTSVHKLLTLLNAKVYSEFSYFFIIIFERLKCFSQVSWNVSLTIFDSFSKSIISQDWHNAWNNMCFDSSSATIFNPLKIDFIIEEQLSDDDIRASITLLLQVLDVIFSAGCLKMYFWISSDDDTEPVSKFFLDKLDDLGCVCEAILDWFPIFFAVWWISSECKDVPYSSFFSSCKDINDILSSHACACDMHQHIETKIFCDM